MVEVYWSCLIGGIVFAIISLIAGDVFEHGLDSLGHSIGADHFDALNPTTIVAAVTTFGGAGILFNEYTSLAGATSIILSASIAIAISVVLHFVWVRPMRRSENSVAFSMNDFPGQLGTVTIAIPSGGFGEVIVRIGAGNTNQIAASFDGRPIRAGQQVVIVEVRGDTLLVTPFDDGNLENATLPVAPTAMVEE